VSKGVETFAYDELNRVTKITQSGNGVSEKRVDMGYDAASQMTGMTRYSDLAGTEEVAGSSYTFDDAGRLTNLVHDTDGDVLSAYEWAYDGRDRITKATTPDGVSDYSYDKTDQLVDAEHDYQDDEAYSYDDNGNRVNDGYEVSENNQLLSDGKFNYSYDKEGNRVSRVEIATGELTKYEWDYRNRLVGVFTKDSSGNVVERNQYTYDVFDNRIAKSVDADGAGSAVAKEEHFVYDGDEIALTFDGEGNQTERFLHGTQIDQVLAQENDNGEVLWALTDNQGSVRMLLDNNGDVVNNITYDAFGNITLETNPEVNFRFSYTGREYDPETGLYNYRARYYDPGVGRFISEDPISFEAGDSNLSRYVNNSPLNYIDPSGFCRITPFPGDDTFKVADARLIPPADFAPMQGADLGEYIFNKTNEWEQWHYNRNSLNRKVTYDKVITEKWILMPSGKSIYHTMGEGNENNLKFVDPTGRHEAVFRPIGNGKYELVTEPRNMGTYNYSPPSNGLQHIRDDVVPYYIFGNTPEDRNTSDRWKTTVEPITKPINEGVRKVDEGVKKINESIKKIGSPKSWNW
jgi:RHS repeat-associated protein